MSDRELLEAAAHAMGFYTVDPRGDDDLWSDGTHGRIGMVTAGGIWNPIEDSEDAFEMVVKLQIHINYAYGNEVYLCANDEEGVISDDDPLLQARKAIVRAAAAIGNKLEKSDE